MKIFWFVSFVSCFCFACSTKVSNESNVQVATSENNANNKSSLPVAASTPEINIEEQLRNEAQQRGESFLDKYLIQCDGSFYWRVNRPVRGETLSYEAKDRLQTEVKGTYYPPKELSQAQRLNGEDPQPLEWSGYVSIHFAAGRNLGGAWHDNAYVSVEVNKCKGKWYVNAATFPSIKTRSKYGAADPYGIQSGFNPDEPGLDRFVEIECDK